MRQLGLKSLILGFIFWYGFSILNYNNNNIINIDKTIYLISIFLIFFLFSYLFFYRTNQIQNSYAEIFISPMVLVYLIVIVGVLYFIISKFSTMHIYTAFSAILVFSYLCYYHSQGLYKFIYLTITIIIFLILLDEYSRRYLLEAFLAIAYLFLLKKKKLLFLDFCKILFITSITILFYFYLTGLRLNELQLNDIFYNILLGWRGTYNAMGFYTIYLTDYVLNFYTSSNFLNGESFIAGFINFIPRALWDSKPIAFSIILSSEYYNLNIDNLFTNFGPGIIAEAYANGGYIFTIFIAIIMGVAVAKFDNFTERRSGQWTVSLIALIIYPTLIFMVRGDFVNSFYDMYARILVLFVLNIFTAKYIEQPKIYEQK